MTDCPNAEIRDLLPGYAHDRLSAVERAAVEAHLATCDDCSEELALVRAAARALGAAPALDLERIAAAVHESAASTRPDRRGAVTARPVHRPLPWRRAAALAAVAVGALSLMIGRRDPVREGDGAPTVAVGVAPPSPGAGTGPAPSSGLPAVRPPAPGATGAENSPRAAEGRGLTMAGGVADLSDAALLALLGDIEALEDDVSTEPADVLPALTDVEEGEIR